MVGDRSGVVARQNSRLRCVRPTEGKVAAHRAVGVPAMAFGVGDLGGRAGDGARVPAMAVQWDSATRGVRKGLREQAHLSRANVRADARRIPERARVLPAYVR